MKEQPLVSIIIPVFQAEYYIDRCIKSVVTQNYPYLDIILIDDGSADGSLQKCNQWKLRDNRIRVFHQVNQGVSITRNRGIEYSLGEYILFLDADDSIMEDYIQKGLCFMEKNNCQVGIFGFQSNRNSKNIQSLFIPDKDMIYKDIQNMKKDFWELFEKGLLHNIGTKIYCKELILQNKIKFKEKSSFLEDILFCLEALQKAKRIGVTPVNGYIYYADNCNSLTKKYRKDYFDNIFLLKQYIKNQFGFVNGKYYRFVMECMYSVIVNEFECDNFDMRKLLTRIKKISADEDVINAKDNDCLMGMPIEQQAIARMLWHRCYCGIYLYGMYKRIKMR